MGLEVKIILSIENDEEPYFSKFIFVFDWIRLELLGIFPAFGRSTVEIKIFLMMSF